jgi:hypothetical protein
MGVHMGNCGRLPSGLSGGYSGQLARRPSGGVCDKGDLLLRLHTR